MRYMRISGACLVLTALTSAGAFSLAYPALSFESYFTSACDAVSVLLGIGMLLRGVIGLVFALGAGRTGNRLFRCVLCIVAGVCLFVFRPFSHISGELLGLLRFFR